MSTPLPPAALTNGGRILSATVKAFPPGAILVEHEGEDLLCEILNEPDLALRDTVLVWVSPDERLKVVLGRVGPRQPTEDPAARGAPEELVLSATKRLVLRCGDGEIILRGDGRVVIRGTELVSKAKGANRIKGGHVVIN